MDNLEDWIEAGKAVAYVAKKIEAWARPGTLLVDLANRIESEIMKQVGALAFPVNISVDNIAAHYTPSFNDKNVLKDGSIVKVDMGANNNGALSDMAITVAVGNVPKGRRELIKATREVLMETIEIIHDGIRILDISKKIWKEAHSRGYGVLTDLGGHNLGRWSLHGGIMIPNAPSSSLQLRKKLHRGMIIAIEPFLVSSQKDSETMPLFELEEIYSLVPQKLSAIKKSPFLSFILKRYKTLPFAVRWIARNKKTLKKVRELIDKYESVGLLIGYPALKDVNNNIVAQFEHTILIKENSAEILTVT